MKQRPSLKDQLAAWKKDHAAPSSPSSPSSGGQRPSARGRPPPRPNSAARGGEVAAPVEPAPPPRTDADLFRDAVARVDRDAVLAKYDAAPAGAAVNHPEDGAGAAGAAAAPVAPRPLYREGEDDAAMFARFVGRARPVASDGRAADAGRPTDGQEAHGRGTRDETARGAAVARLQKRVAKGQVQPQATLDLHGEDRLSAAGRVQAFLGAARGQGLAHVLIVHGKGTGTLHDVVVQALDADPGVAEHCAASPKLGGAGARVARLKR